MSEGELILYHSVDGRSEIQLRAIEGTVWLTQAQIAELFSASPQAITQLIRAVYDEAELTEEATCKDFLQVRSEGARQVRRQLKHYNLDMILAVGYRVRSPRGVQFRQWASTALKEYLVKGFIINDARLKEPGGFDYFDELIERIRDIRASEKRFYQKVRDVFAETSVDYDGKAETAQTFFKTIQNKMLYAVTRQTAAELIVARADASQPNMAVQSWKGARVRKGDVTVAKNYLKADEIEDLNRLVTMFLDFAENQARRRKQLTMADWISRTDDFLRFNEHDVLNNAGRVSHAQMEQIAHQRFAEFDASRRAAETIEAEAEYLEELQEIEAKLPKPKHKGKP
ncbi:virulence RhuM family protein [Aquabacter sediminis]|uniref:virulence RhuM family protein n=1 Tax=Aquabacter sediminis TaxID=3029197 RepID=UPI00237DEC40|nr:virulence RhuM family protein [Aquabacter sp. P-9]MDE1567099.1 virulence RhuM family protein [Aquabacter sp. P-9]